MRLVANPALTVNIKTEGGATQAKDKHFHSRV